MSIKFLVFVGGGGYFGFGGGFGGGGADFIFMGARIFLNIARYYQRRYHKETA